MVMYCGGGLGDDEELRQMRLDGGAASCRRRMRVVTEGGSRFLSLLCNMSAAILPESSTRTLCFSFFTFQMEVNMFMKFTGTKQHNPSAQSTERQAEISQGKSFSPMGSDGEKFLLAVC